MIFADIKAFRGFLLYSNRQYPNAREKIFILFNDYLKIFLFLIQVPLYAETCSFF